MTSLRQPAALVLALVLVYAGITLPDTDQWLPLLGHRSAVTHGMLLPLLVFWRWRPAGGFLGGGVAIHLAADLLSRKWVGYALVKLPFFGALDPAGSQLFLAANALVGLVLYDRAASEAGGRRLLWAGLAASATVYFLVNEGYWLVLAPLALLVLLLAWRR